MLVAKVNLAEFYLKSFGLAHEEVQQAQLVFLDPPFNIGEKYQDWDDNLDEDDYVFCLTDWIRAAAEILAPNGSLWVNIPDRWAANVVVIARDCFDFTLENWCQWHYRFGVHQRDRFIVSKTHALWFSKGSPIVNREFALVPSLRAEIYNDSRIWDTDGGGERMDFDVWGFEPYWGRVQGNNKERRKLHHNQLPEKYMDRIVRVCSNPGDVVVDGFCGSGSFTVVADTLKRRCFAFDVTEKYLKSAAERTRLGAVRVQP